MSGDKMALQTQPHSRSWGGLCGHSVGPTYPFTVVGVGLEREGYVLNAVTGETWPRESLKAAFDRAEKLKAGAS